MARELARDRVGGQLVWHQSFDRSKAGIGGRSKSLGEWPFRKHPVQVGSKARHCSFEAYAPPSRSGGWNASPVSVGKKIQVSCDTSVIKVSTSGRPIGLA